MAVFITQQQYANYSDFITVIRNSPRLPILISQTAVIGDTGSAAVL
jgi:hypothetical protein